MVIESNVVVKLACGGNLPGGGLTYGGNLSVVGYLMVENTMVENILWRHDFMVETSVSRTSTLDGIFYCGNLYGVEQPI